jgi:glutamyl-tRNA synthetase
LHLGNIRAAVFNWLFTRHHDGVFILRIEDTDTARNVEGSEQGILDDLRWLGLDWDEGPDVGGPHGPYRQSGRADLHAAALEKLIASAHAYPCFCDEEEHDGDAGGDRPARRYAGTCRRLSAEDCASRLASGAEHVIRFAVPDDLDKVEFGDEIFGTISFPASDIDDFVLRRTDGRVVYNFGVVVDDIDMEITHVIRGVGHLSNTPKQVLLFNAFERAVPVFAHFPTVLGSDGLKLSKRAGATPVNELQRQGFPPDAVLNYLSLLGWSHPEEKEVLTRSELVAAMSLDRVGKSDTQMDAEKLLWVCQQHLALESLEELTGHVEPFIDRDRFAGLRADASAAVDALRTRLSTYGDINDHLAMLFPEDETAAASICREVGADAEARAVLAAVRARLEVLESWQAEELNGAVRAGGGDAGVRGASLFHPLRLVLIGAEKGPELGKLLAGVGMTEAFRRIDEALS